MAVTDLVSLRDEMWVRLCVVCFGKDFFLSIPYLRHGDPLVVAVTGIVSLRDEMETKNLLALSRKDTIPVENVSVLFRPVGTVY